MRRVGSPMRKVIAARTQSIQSLRNYFVIQIITERGNSKKTLPNLQIII